MSMKRLAVTGVSGTFGREFVRQAITGGVERLVGVSRDELKQADVAEAHVGDAALRLFLGDVRDCDRLQEAFYQCDAVVHAAALKRVDAGAYNPGEMTRTNIGGTENVIRAALAAGVKKVLVISSDKSCAPANIYGASKLMAEQIAVHSNTYAAPRGMTVSVLRYGNVLGSRGSVIPLWRRQCADGSPLTLTHPDMMRFVVTIQAAVQLAFSALDLMRGGEIFVPFLQSARMMDLAEAVGGPGYPVTVTGLRPGGEKMHEVLLADDEPARATARVEFYIVRPHVHSWVDAWPWGATQLSPGFRYVSDGTRGLLNRDQLVRLLEEAGV